MNKLYVGFGRNVELPKGGCLLIDDELRDVPRARVFDPLKHSFNPLQGMDHRKARNLSRLLYEIYPEGDATLTVRNGKRALMQMLLEGERRLDKLNASLGGGQPGSVEAADLIGDLLFSPVLKRVLCNPTNFSFRPGSTIMARLDRAELGEFDALALGFFLMNHFKGTVVVPDFGFYGREPHAGLVREGRLVAGVNFLGELPARLRSAVLLIEDKEASGATFQDAETLAQYRRLQWGTNAYNDFVKDAMA